MARYTLVVALSLFTASISCGSPTQSSAPTSVAQGQQLPQNDAPQLARLIGTPDENMVLFRDMLETHYYRIFPDGRRNAGGPQFFKYIHDQLATSHELFERYNQFYCGVSGSIVSPARKQRLDTVKIKDASGRCVMGQYIRCCWPCSCDIMKHARAEKVDITLPKDPKKEVRSYWVLTIGDPCAKCDLLPCPAMPPEVSAYDCGGGRTKNGLRVKNGRLTDDPDGRLVFALLYEGQSAQTSTLAVEDELLDVCSERFTATPSELENLGGMGDIFVELSLVNSDEKLTNTTKDLCE